MFVKEHNPSTTTCGERVRAPAVLLVHDHAQIFSPAHLFCSKKFCRSFDSFASPQPRVQNCIRVLVKNQDPAVFPPNGFMRMHVCVCGWVCAGVCACVQGRTLICLCLLSRRAEPLPAHTAVRGWQRSRLGEKGGKKKNVCV